MASNPLSERWKKIKTRDKVIIFGVLGVLAWAFVTSGDRTKTVMKTIPDEYASAGRQLYVHAPGDPSNPLPLVLILHDDSSKATEIERESDASQLADTHNFAVAYPEAVGGLWRVADPRGADAQYLRDVVQYVSRESKIDSKRVYVWGLGEGGRLALEVACTGRDRVFAAVGVVGRFDPEPAVSCPPGVGKVPVADEAWNEKVTKALWDGSKSYPQLR